MLIMARFLPAALAAFLLAGTAGAELPAALSDADFHPPASAARVELGRQLFFDKILSGNLNIACATCHHPFAGTGDGLSLSVGEGARGTGIVRDTGTGIDAIRERVPRNAPALFNLGAREFSSLFHDGRVAPDRHAPSGFTSPAGEDLPPGLDNVLAAQAMFPVTSGTEMAGQRGENPVADAAAREDLPAVWNLLAARLRTADGYVEQFIAAFDDVKDAADITFVHAANAIAAFEAVAWRSDDSPFDRFLRGDRLALNPTQQRGMRLFYGRAGCSGCHSGPLQTDHSFRAIAMPQVGPGKDDGATGYEDFGRERVTGMTTDRYRFRVPSLRNVALTAPYGHAGTYNTLESTVRHHLDPVPSLYDFDLAQVVLPSRPDLDEHDAYAAGSEPIRAAIAAANELAPVVLRESEVGAIIAFLHALTDTSMLDLRRDVPRSVASGLPLPD
jgi:cytochrome c peroxidase